MKNALKYGLLIGILSGAWIMVMHAFGVYHQDKSGPFYINWMEYISILIPFTGLYLGIKNYRNNINGGHLDFFGGLIEGFKILIVGFVLYAAASSVYIFYSGSKLANIDYLERISAAGIVGIVFNLIISRSLANKEE